MWHESLLQHANCMLDFLRNANKKLITAESCTGGLVAGLCTSVAGSSDVIEGGFCTYSNYQKIQSLDVPEYLLSTYGAVSDEVAKAMAEGALHNSRADISVALTGIAGPSGGTDEKPVGLVYIATTIRDGSSEVEKHLFVGDREKVRLRSVEKALLAVIDRVQ